MAYTKLHEKARTSLKGEVLTVELLNKLDKFNNTVWHIAANLETLKDIPRHLFTKDVMNQKNDHGHTVWDLAVENELSGIPEHLFTKKVLTEETVRRGSIFMHAAAKYSTLNAIPQHLFSEKILNKKNSDGQTVWHVAAKYGTLNVIPKHLFTSTALIKLDNSGESVWQYIATNELIAEVPLRLITKDLLDMKDNRENILFCNIDKAYINNVITERLNNSFTDFITNNPELEKDIVHRDPRLILEEASRNELVFRFTGIEDKVILAKDGVFLNNENYKTLNTAVLFMENNYENIEKSISLPVNDALYVGKFVL